MPVRRANPNPPYRHQCLPSEQAEWRRLYATMNAQQRIDYPIALIRAERRAQRGLSYFAGPLQVLQAILSGNKSGADLPRHEREKLLAQRAMEVRLASYATVEANGHIPSEEFLREKLGSDEGRLLVQHMVARTLEIAQLPGRLGQVPIHYVMDDTRMFYHGPRPKGERKIKVDRNMGPALARLCLILYPGLRGEIEILGMDKPLYDGSGEITPPWPWFQPADPFVPRWKGPAGSPLPDVVARTFAELHHELF